MPLHRTKRGNVTVTTLSVSNCGVRQRKHGIYASISIGVYSLLTFISDFYNPLSQEVGLFPSTPFVIV